MYCENLPGFFDFQDIYRFAVQEASDGANFVEVSAFLGRSACFLAEIICASKKRIRLDVVGPFPPDQCAAYLVHMQAAGAEGIAPPRRMPLKEAAKLYPPESLDFVFLNADRSAQNLDQWHSCLKPGGVLAGHGYSAEYPERVWAVEEHFGPDCAVPPRSWAIRKEANLALPNRLGSRPVAIPSASMEPGALQDWRQATMTGTSEADAQLAFEAPRFGEAALETLLFLAGSESAEVRLQASSSLAALLTLPMGVSPIAQTIIEETLAVLREDADAGVRRTAASAFRYLQTVQCRKSQGWLRQSSQGEASERVKALQALQSLPREIVAQAYRPVPGERLWDCLDRAECQLPAPAARSAACVATVADLGDSAALDAFLTALSRCGGSAKPAVVVFAEEGDVACEQVVRRHHAILAPYRRCGCPEASLHSLLYSVARVVDADKYLCLSCRSRLTGSLGPLFSALDALHEDSLLLGPPAAETVPWEWLTSGPAPGELNEENRKDILFLTGEAGPDEPMVRRHPGVFAGRHRAMLSLDDRLRRWQPFAAAWIDGGGDQSAWREEAVFSLAVANCGAAVEMQMGAAGIDPP